MCWYQCTLYNINSLQLSLFSYLSHDAITLLLFICTHLNNYYNKVSILLNHCNKLIIISKALNYIIIMIRVWHKRMLMTFKSKLSLYHFYLLKFIYLRFQYNYLIIYCSVYVKNDIKKRIYIGNLCHTVEIIISFNMYNLEYIHVSVLNINSLNF